MELKKRKQIYEPKTNIKSKKIPGQEHPYSNYISWAFLKQIREHNDTRKVYDVNPYVEVFQFEKNFYGLYTHNIDGKGDVWMYVIDGPEKAMLIDTAYGLGDLEGLVKEITGNKPFIVVNTHTGPDHCLGNFRFDTIYCHEYEVWSIRNKCSKNCFDYLFDENGNCKWIEFDKNDLPEYKDFNLIGVEDGFTFHLGDGYDIELVWTAGHAAGHAMFLDKQNRILISGDDLIAATNGVGNGPRPGDPYGKYSTIEAYYQQMKKIALRIDEYDYIYGGHFAVGLESNVIIDVVETAGKILENPNDYDIKKERRMMNGMRTVYCKNIPGFTTISYNLEKGVYMDKAQQIVDEYQKTHQK